jgi:DMSO/TMAO reductase YedYZ molybdopterin-dependent catalytic subunit
VVEARHGLGGRSLDKLLAEARARGVESAPYVLAVSDGGYTTNLPLADVTHGKAWVAVKYAGEPLAAEHGGPARLLVPYLYFWKSAKWVRQLRLMDRDEPGFWESLGYHTYGVARAALRRRTMRDFRCT